MNNTEAYAINNALDMAISHITSEENITINSIKVPTYEIK